MEQNQPTQDQPQAENVLTKYQWVQKTFQHWNGTPFEAPPWARKVISTQEMQAHYKLRTKEETVLRMGKPHHYSLELNGLNKRALFDIKIMLKNHPVNMGLRCYSKTRMASSFNTVDMHFPYSCWKQMTETMSHLAKQKLPPATADFKEQSGHLMETHKFVVKNQNENWHFNLAVENFKAQAGNERMILIEAVNLQKNEKFRFRIPWVHLPVFNHYAELITQEYKTHL